MTIFPKHLSLNEGTLYEGFEAHGDWSTNQGGVAADTTYFLTGTQSVKFTSTAGPQSNSYLQKTISRTFVGTEILSVDVYCDIAEYGSSINILLATDSGFAAFFSSTSRYIKQGWNRLVFPLSEFTTTSGASWADPKVRLRIKMGVPSGETFIGYFDNMCLDSSALPAICVTFDDALAGVYEHVFPYMETLGLKGTVYVISERVGTPGYCTTAQLQEMYAAGWDMANHTSDHSQLALLADDAAVTAKITPCTDYLTANSMPRAAYHLAYPGGSHNHTFVFDGMTAAGMLSGRTIAGQTFSLPHRYWYDLESVSVVFATAWSTIKAHVDNAERREQCLTLYFHDIKPDASTGTDVLLSWYQTFIAYCVELGLPLLTISELYGLNTGRVQHSSTVLDELRLTRLSVTALPVLRDATYYAGDTAEVVLTVTDASGNPVDLTGATARYVISTNGTATAVLDIDTSDDEMAVTDATSGELTMAFTVPNTRGWYRHELEVTDGGGNVVTAMIGRVYIRESLA